jgi:ATP-dependent protease Clp ATPase subunit
MFEMPSRKDISEITVDEAVIEGLKEPVITLGNKKQLEKITLGKDSDVLLTNKENKQAS